jgi:glycyl-tRNA synthetase
MELGVPEDKQRFIEKLDWERAHYSMQGFDQEIYLERWGWVEVSGHNYRTDFDLRRHMESSGVDMTVFKEYEKPVWKEEITIQPVMPKIGPDFKGKASEIVKLLSNADPKKVQVALKRKAFYPLKGFKILPEHVQIMRKKVKKQGKRFIPQVIEPSFGSDRLVYIALEYAYKTKRGRTLLNLPRDLAPIQMSVYPLVSKDGLPEKAKQIYQMLMDEKFVTKYDESGAIGRRYARADEIGTPLGVTVDYQTLKDDTVTVRDRDTWKQVRTAIEELPELLWAYFKYQIDFDGLGQPIKD